MGVGQNKSALAVNNHTGTEAVPLVSTFVSRVEEILKKRIEERIHPVSRKRAHLFANLIFGAYVYDCRADLSNCPNHRRFTAVFFGMRKKRPIRYQDNLTNKIS